MFADAPRPPVTDCARAAHYVLDTFAKTEDGALIVGAPHKIGRHSLVCVARVTSTGERFRLVVTLAPARGLHTHQTMIRMRPIP